MNSYLWGPLAWNLFHCMTLNTDKNIKIGKYHLFFNSLKELLPCKVCRIHYKEHLTQDPVSKNKNIYELSKWCFKLHNKVNRSLSKPIIPLKKALRLYIDDNGKVLFNHFSAFLFINSLMKNIADSENSDYENCDKVENNLSKFFEGLSYSFPCIKCRKMLRDSFSKLPRDADIVEWYLGFKDGWQKDHLYKGCERLLKCKLKLVDGSISENIKLGKKGFLIKPSNFNNVIKIVKLEYVKKGDVNDVYGVFKMKNGKTVKRLLVSDLESKYKIDSMKITDVISMDQEKRYHKLNRIKWNYEYLGNNLALL